MPRCCKGTISRLRVSSFSLAGDDWLLWAPSRPETSLAHPLLILGPSLACLWLILGTSLARPCLIPCSVLAQHWLAPASFLAQHGLITGSTQLNYSSALALPSTILLGPYSTPLIISFVPSKVYFVGLFSGTDQHIPGSELCNDTLNYLSLRYMCSCFFDTRALVAPLLCPLCPCLGLPTPSTPSTPSTPANLLGLIWSIKVPQTVCCWYGGVILRVCICQLRDSASVR